MNKWVLGLKVLMLWNRSFEF